MKKERVLQVSQNLLACVHKSVGKVHIQSCAPKVAWRGTHNNSEERQIVPFGSMNCWVWQKSVFPISLFPFLTEFMKGSPFSKQNCTHSFISHNTLYKCISRRCNFRQLRMFTALPTVMYFVRSCYPAVGYKLILKINIGLRTKLIA